MPIFFTYDPNDPRDDEILAKKRREVAATNRVCRKMGIPKRIRLSYRPVLDPKYAWKYDLPEKRSVRVEDAKRVIVYWSHVQTSPKLVEQAFEECREYQEMI